MRTFIEILALVVLAIPIAVLFIFNLPGLGIIAAVILVTAVCFVEFKRESATNKDQEPDNDAAHKKAA